MGGMADTKEDIAELPACDVKLAGIEWQPSMALVFTLVLPNGRRAHLKATLARHLMVRLEFDERTGRCPMTWDTVYSKLSGNEWHVLMDFAGDGSIEFDCSELHFEYVT